MVGPVGLCTSPAPTAGRECPADDHLFNIAVNQSTAACSYCARARARSIALEGRWLMPTASVRLGSSTSSHRSACSRSGTLERRGRPRQGPGKR
jgi:hypothetical protein